MILAEDDEEEEAAAAAAEGAVRECLGAMVGGVCLLMALVDLE